MPVNWSLREMDRQLYQVAGTPSGDLPATLATLMGVPVDVSINLESDPRVPVKIKVLLFMSLNTLE